MTARLAHTPRWLVGAAFIAGISAACAIGMAQVVPKLFPADGETVSAVFTDTGSLSEGSPVRVRGVEAGEIEAIELDSGGRTATVRMKVHDDALPVHADARASIKWRTLLGRNLAIDLDPGTAGRLDGPIPPNRTSTQVELDDVTTAATDEALEGLRSMLDEAPRGLADSEALETALRSLADASPALGEGTDALRGHRAGDMRALIENAAAVMQAVDQPTDPLRDIVAGAGTTLSATGRRRADIAATLRRAPVTLRATRDTVHRLDTTLALADPLLENLTEPAGDVAPTVRALRPVLLGADRLLADAVPLLRSLRPAATDLAATARDTTPLLEGLDPSIRRVADEILPAFAEIDPTSRRRTYEMVGPTFAGLTGAAAQFDAEGHWFRFPALGGPNSPDTVPCKQFVTDPDDQRVAECVAMFDTLNGIFAKSVPSRTERRP